MANNSSTSHSVEKIASDLIEGLHHAATSNIDPTDYARIAERKRWLVLEALKKAAALSGGPEGEATEAMVIAGRDAMVAYLYGDCPGDKLCGDAQLEALRRAYRAMAAAALSGATEREGGSNGV